MSAYRFCRTDDIGLLVDALNRCWAPHFPAESPTTPASFKRSIRDLQVWCSSCMVAFSGSDPIGVLIGAKRPSGTLIHKIAVHPDHVRQGHGRHMLTSLGSKLAILGPPRMVAEVPESFEAACGLFSASGYEREALLTDYVLHPTAHTTRRGEPGEPVESAVLEMSGRFLIPVTVDDLAANGLLEEAPPSPSAQGQRVCWERSVETVTARKDDLAGLAVASDERIEAHILYTPAQGPDDASGASRGGAAEIVAVGSFVEDGGARLKRLLAQLGARGLETVRFPKVHPAEISEGLLETLGFRPAGRHLLYAGQARSG
jgi:hypothetical protein